MKTRSENRLLICNSDDFGLTKSVSDAILETYLSGIMTSTTIMANMPAVEYAAKLAHANKGLGVGIHFNLTEGRPLSEPSTVELLLDKNGIFLDNGRQRKNLMFGKSKTIQAALELEAQLVRIMDLGIRPTHFDSHHHITGVPCAFEASVAVAKKLGVPSARITSIAFSKSPEVTFSNQTRWLLGNFKSLPKTIVHVWNKARLRKHGLKTPDVKILPSRVIPQTQNPVEQFIRTLSCHKP